MADGAARGRATGTTGGFPSSSPGCAPAARTTSRSSRDAGEATWQTLGLQIRTGNFTPVLGPGLADSILGSRQDIARRWVERWQMPLARHSQGDLAQVAQYLRVRSADGHRPRPALRLPGAGDREAARRRDRAGRPVLGARARPAAARPAIVEVGRRLRRTDPGDPYRVMAALPVKVYVTTAWTDLLQDALRNRPEPREPTTMVFRWNGRRPERREPAGPRRGADGRAAARLPPVRPASSDPQSLVLTEDDYFGWFTAWHARRRKDIPAVVTERARREVAALPRLPARRLGLPRRLPRRSRASAASELMEENLHVGVQLSPENQLIEPEAAQEYLESYFGNDRSTSSGATRAASSTSSARGPGMKT